MDRLIDSRLGDAAKVYTLHGYCQHLLRRVAGLRGNLTANFRCFPGLVSLIKVDWDWLRGSPAPKFVDLMRKLTCAYYIRDCSHLIDVGDVAVHRVGRDKIFFAGFSFNLVAIKL